MQRIANRLGQVGFATARVADQGQKTVGVVGKGLGRTNGVIDPRDRAIEAGKGFAAKRRKATLGMQFAATALNLALLQTATGLQFAKHVVVNRHIVDKIASAFTTWTGFIWLPWDNRWQHVGSRRYRCLDTGIKSLHTILVTGSRAGSANS